MMHAMQEAQARIAAFGADLSQAPAEWRTLLDTFSGALMSGAGVRSVTYAMILLLVGGSVEWLYWTYAYGPLRAIQASPAASHRQALRLGLRRLALLCCGIALFTLAVIGTSAAFTWPSGVHEIAVAVTLLLLVLRLTWGVAAVVLAQRRPSLRLVPVEKRGVPWIRAAAMVLAFVLGAGWVVPELLEHVAGAPHVAGVLRLGLATLAALVSLVAAFAFFGSAAPGPGGKRRLPRFPKSFVVAMLVLLVYALWLMSRTEVAAIGTVVALVALVQMILHDLVFYFWADAPKPVADPEMAAPVTTADTVDPSLLPNIVLSGARFIVAAIGLGACAVVLDTPLAELATRQGPLVRFAFSLLGVAALGLLTHLVWIAIRTTIDQRLSRIPPLDPEGEPSPEARMLTLLPLLRVSAAVALGVMLLLSSLWAIGIEITPLLAGAGVIGLALGFGAQALVRDVIAGIFFLAEDAFRVGEYIESGTATKGTVERITLRTVALRHHNGPLHFVPYGTLGTVRNNSRDWWIEKFNLPLPIDVDSETVRKLIKKVGQEMLEDPEIGPLMHEPLKGKLYRIDPGVKIFRCKFETAPGKQFDVRAQAYRRLEAALKAKGIAFADGRQMLLLRQLSDDLDLPNASPA